MPARRISHVHKRGWSAFLVGAVAIAVLALPARADIATPTPLPYGSPAVVTLPDWVSLDATLQVDGGCFGTPLPAQADRTRDVIVKATAVGQGCSVAVIDAAGTRLAAAVFTTVLGRQRAQLVRPGGRMRVGSTRTLAPRDQRTLQGVPLTFAVASGHRVCRVSKIRGSWVLSTKARGACTVSVAAVGVPERYEPYTNTLTFAVQSRR